MQSGQFGKRVASVTPIMADQGKIREFGNRIKRIELGKEILYVQEVR